MRSMWTRWREQGGQALILFVLMLLVLFAAIAMAVDGGYAYAQRRRMQYAADAAAMAGARALALNWNNSAIEQAVAQYAQANGATSWSWYLKGNNTVHVEVARTFSTFFAGIVGINQMTATASSEASVSGVKKTGNLLPIAVEQFNFQFNQVYKLWDKESKTAPGNFGWLDWNGGSPSAPELAQNICNPENSGEWEVGWWVPGAPGVKKSSAVISCLNNWVGQPVTIIIYDSVEGTGNNTKYHIAGFAKFVIVGFNFTGHDKYILGKFIRYVTEGEGGGPDFGLTAISLGSSITDLVLNPSSPEPPGKETPEETKEKEKKKTETPKPTEEHKKTKTPKPTEAPKPTETPEKKKTPTPTFTPTPCEDEGGGSKEHDKTKTPEPTETKEHEKHKTKTPEPTETKEHEHDKTKTPEPTETKEHEHEKTKTPEPTETKEHEHEKTKTPEPTETKEHEHDKTKTPEPTETK